MELEQLVGEARERELRPMPARERVVAGLFALVCLLGAAAIAVLVPSNRSFHPLVLVGLAAVWLVARRVSFEVGSIEMWPDQLVFVPTLFIAPLPLVPLLALGVCLLSRLPDFLRRRMHPDRWLYPIGDCIQPVATVTALAVLAPGPVSSRHIPAYVAVLAVEYAVGVVRDVVADRALGVQLPDAVRAAIHAYRIDAVLAPVALAVAAVGQHEPAAVLAVLPLMWLLRVFSNERRDRIAAALELNQAYRGTVMVLSDVVEAEDDYTASHCRSVVELTAAVAKELDLDQSTRQELEIAALLHDVGKIAIPNEILNKPAKLTEEEFDLMKTHTLEGQALLDRVGGRLAKVGRIVRSCHERWDGRGYPDQLAGEQIPVAARIVFACDAYSAMTTDRPYRRAMSPEAALEELRRNSGTQFEPRVVGALESIIERDASVAAPHSYTDALRAVLAGSAPPALELSS